MKKLVRFSLAALALLLAALIPNASFGAASPPDVHQSVVSWRPPAQVGALRLRSQLVRAGYDWMMYFHR
jgi:hypothetical protein